MREAGIDYHRQQFCYNNLLLWDMRHRTRTLALTLTLTLTLTLALALALAPT